MEAGRGAGTVELVDMDTVDTYGFWDQSLDLLPAMSRSALAVNIIWHVIIMIRLQVNRPQAQEVAPPEQGEGGGGVGGGRHQQCSHQCLRRRQQIRVEV